MQIWQTQEAKTRLSELIRKAKEEPQLITIRGEEAVVVLSKEKYDELTKDKLSIFEAMQKSPFKDLELDLKRSTDSKLRDPGL